jgi:hypothetical protein
MGWPPALEAAGKEWQAPHLAWPLEGPYDAVRYIAQRSLRCLPGFETFSYDFLCGPAQRKDAREQVLKVWSDHTKTEAVPENSESVLLDNEGKVLFREQQKLRDSRSNRVIRLIE